MAKIGNIVVLVKFNSKNEVDKKITLLLNEKITKMWLLLFLMMPFTIVISQVSDLSLIDGLTEGLSKKNNQEPLLPDEEDKDYENLFNTLSDGRQWTDALHSID